LTWLSAKLPKSATYMSKNSADTSYVFSASVEHGMQMHVFSTCP